MGYTAIQASRLTGCSISQVRYWRRTGLVAPSGDSGSGDPRDGDPRDGDPGPGRYAFRDLVALRMVRSLLDAGLPLQRVRRAVEHLGSGAAELTGLRLVTDGSSVFACHDDGEVLDALRGGQLALFVSVDAVAAEVESEVRAFRLDRDAFVGTLRDVDEASGPSA